MFLEFLNEIDPPIEKNDILKAASIFKKGAPISAAILQSQQTLIKKSNPKFLPKEIENSASDLKNLKSGTYYLTNPKHAMALVKLDNGDYYFFDPNAGLYEYKSGQEKLLVKDMNKSMSFMVKMFVGWLEDAVNLLKDKAKYTDFTKLEKAIQDFKKGEGSAETIQKELDAVKRKSPLAEKVCKYLEISDNIQFTLSGMLKIEEFGGIQK